MAVALLREPLSNFLLADVTQLQGDCASCIRMRCLEVVLGEV